MYSGGFYPYETLEEYWAYWSRYITVNRYTAPPKPVYQTLLKLVKDKDYFVLTTNVDHCFQKAGFDKKRLFYTQGDYGLFQCSKRCGLSLSGYLRRVGAGKPAAVFPSQRFHALYQRVNVLRDNLTTQPMEQTAAQLNELAGEILTAYTSGGVDDGDH